MAKSIHQEMREKVAKAQKVRQMVSKAAENLLKADAEDLGEGMDLMESEDLNEALNSETTERKDTKEETPAGKKKCTICGKVLSIDEFHKDSQKKDGHSSWCKPCTKIKANKATAPVRPKVETDPTKKTRKPLTPEQKATRAAAAKARRAAAKSAS